MSCNIVVVVSYNLVVNITMQCSQYENIQRLILCGRNGCQQCCCIDSIADHYIHCRKNNLVYSNGKSVARAREEGSEGKSQTLIQTSLNKSERLLYKKV